MGTANIFLDFRCNVIFFGLKSAARASWACQWPSTVQGFQVVNYSQTITGGLLPGDWGLLHHTLGSSSGDISPPASSLLNYHSTNNGILVGIHVVQTSGRMGTAWCWGPMSTTWWAVSLRGLQSVAAWVLSVVAYAPRSSYFSRALAGPTGQNHPEILFGYRLSLNLNRQLYELRSWSP